MSTYTTTTLSPDMIKGVALVGRIVTFGYDTYRVHSAEGQTWYAFNDKGTTTLDANMTPAPWLITTMLTIVPTHSKIGDGNSREIGIDNPWLKIGISLDKH